MDRNKKDKKSLTKRLKELVLRRRSRESEADGNGQRIYELHSTPEPQSAPRQPASARSSSQVPDHAASSIFIQLGEQAAEQEEQAQSNLLQMERNMDEDVRRSWPLQNIEILKRGGALVLGDRSAAAGAGAADGGFRRSSVIEAVERAKERRRSLQVLPQPAPNVPDGHADRTDDPNELDNSSNTDSSGCSTSSNNSSPWE